MKFIILAVIIYEIMCRNNIIISFFIIIIMWLILSKTILTGDCTENMSNRLQYADDILIYNTSPNEPDYYYISYKGGKLQVPDSTILVNKGLYDYSPDKYTMKQIDKQEQRSIKTSIEKDHKIAQIVDSTYCCDDLINRTITHNYQYDNVLNRFGQNLEDYFD